MKRYSLILCMVLIVSLSGVASAQIVLGPPAAGAPAALSYRVFGITYGPYLGTAPPNYVGQSSFYTYIGYPISTSVTLIAYAQAAFEFNLGPAIPPTFTSKNFTARLYGLSVTNSSAYYGTDAMNVDLFDMRDGNEDGNVYYGDYNRTRGSRIARRTHTFDPVTPVPADFDNIDVTCAVRNDLFGAGAGDYSGFILKSPDAQYEFVSYDSAPTLMFNPGFTGPKCGCGCGGGGGGGCFIANAAR